MLLHWEPFYTFHTPIAWTGFIALADGWCFQLRGRSLGSSRPIELLLMTIWSVPAWLVFEAYDLHLHNWHYIGLPANPILADLGYAWAFATILPGVLEATELLGAVGIGRGWVGTPWKPSRSLVVAMAVIGGMCLILPLLLPSSVATFLFGLVWLGFILLLDPILELSGGRSLLRQMARGDYRRLGQLIVSGALCGFLWEFWNFWAGAKWIYDVPPPLGSGPHVFEMPLAGFIGFLPFAIECEELQNIAVLVARWIGLPIEPDE